MSQKAEFHNLDNPNDGLFRDLAPGLTTRMGVRIAGAEILRNVSLHVRRNSFVALVGRNGAGKTTLMRSVMNLIPQSSGQVIIDDRITTRVRPSDHARHGIGYMPEDRRLIANWSVEQNILLPTWANPVPESPTRLAWCYALVPEIAPFARRRAAELSGGQQKLVALARADGRAQPAPARRAV